MSKSRSSRSRSSSTPAKSRGDGLSPAVRAQRVARLLAAGRGERLGPNHYAEADALLKPLSAVAPLVDKLSSALNGVAPDPPTFATNAVRVPRITFVRYADLTEIYVNGRYFTGKEAVVADEHLSLARQLEAVGAADVRVVEHGDLTRYPS